jgi:hypothetical protein
LDGLDGAFHNSVFLIQIRTMLSARHEHATAAKPGTPGIAQLLRAAARVGIAPLLELVVWSFLGALTLVLGASTDRAPMTNGQIRTLNREL